MVDETNPVAARTEASHRTQKASLLFHYALFLLWHAFKWRGTWNGLPICWFGETRWRMTEMGAIWNKVKSNLWGMGESTHAWKMDCFNWWAGLIVLKAFLLGIGGIGIEKAVRLLVGVLPVEWFGDMNRCGMNEDLWCCEWFHCGDSLNGNRGVGMAGSAALEGYYHHHSHFVDTPSLTTVSLGHYEPNYHCSVTVHSTLNISHFTVDVRFPPGFDFNETKCQIQ